MIEPRRSFTQPAGIILNEHRRLVDIQPMLTPTAGYQSNVDPISTRRHPSKLYCPIFTRCLRRRLGIGPTSARYPPDDIPASYTARHTADAYPDGWISVRHRPNIRPTLFQQTIRPDIYLTLTPTAGYQSMCVSVTKRDR